MDIEVTIISAKGLRNADDGWLTGKSDPYCICRVSGLLSHSDRTKFRTRSLRDTLNPNWNFTSVLKLDTQKLLEFEVWDEDLGSHDDFLGRATFHCKRLVPDQDFEGDLKLTGALAQGSVRVRIKVLRIHEYGLMSVFCCCRS
eukprot:symbB.v1.2.029656.t1/scaffold3276.1/size59877/2